MNRIQEIEKILKQLREDKNPKLVEGKKDKQNLEALNIQNIRLIQNSSLQKTVEETKEKEVILLTDYDRTGELILKRLEELYHNQGVKTNTYYRKKIKQLMKIRIFEELVPRYNKIKKQYEKTK